ncbi:DUF6415 family natural product biosynthesis protein [Streptomyces sp. HD]|uniref:DUF6415 family natural product biosynthesis protein n=1 Tax=Streptomyces sp. HD TaxID=3020892 RepID=UPI002330E9B2|nr:DUF6415 family natural product biosynthesis protein [Streptomyces sp. HD]MDC0765511.1 DUF6415 family natural product biosynthesis protein [Streptomyces sp. HD]
MRIYTVDRSGTVIEDRGTVSVTGQSVAAATDVHEPATHVSVPPCRTGCAPMNTSAEADAPDPSMAAMRASASWFIDQTTLLGHQTVKSFEVDFRTELERLIPQIEKLAAGKPRDDVPTQVALAAVEVSRHRMNATEAAGLRGETERVRLIARSVMSLSHHHDALTGVTMCLACDRIIEDNDKWEPYDYGSSTSRTTRPGRFHAACVNQRR